MDFKKAKKQQRTKSKIPTTKWGPLPLPHHFAKNPKPTPPKFKRNKSCETLLGTAPFSMACDFSFKEYIPSYHRSVTAAWEETLIRPYVATKNEVMDAFCFPLGLGGWTLQSSLPVSYFLQYSWCFFLKSYFFLMKVKTETIFVSLSQVFSFVWTVVRSLGLNSVFLIPKPKWLLESFLWRVTQPTGNGKLFRLARNSQIFSPSIWFLRWYTYIYFLS